MFGTGVISEGVGGSGDREVSWIVTPSFERCRKLSCIAAAWTWSLLVDIFRQDCCAQYNLIQVFDLLLLYSLGYYSVIIMLLAVSGPPWFHIMRLRIWGLFSAT